MTSSTLADPDHVKPEINEARDAMSKDSSLYKVSFRLMIDGEVV